MLARAFDVRIVNSMEIYRGSPISTLLTQSHGHAMGRNALGHEYTNCLYDRYANDGDIYKKKHNGFTVLYQFAILTKELLR